MLPDLTHSLSGKKVVFMILWANAHVMTTDKLQCCVMVSNSSVSKTFVNSLKPGKNIASHDCQWLLYKWLFVFRQIDNVFGDSRNQYIFVVAHPPKPSSDKAKCCCSEVDIFRKNISIAWLLMAWLLVSPGHQQPCYWLCEIWQSLSSTRKYFNDLRHLFFQKL